jgi:hypothetical protein
MLATGRIKFAQFKRSFNVQLKHMVKKQKSKMHNNLPLTLVTPEISSSPYKQAMVGKTSSKLLVLQLALTYRKTGR